MITYIFLPKKHVIRLISFISIIAFYVMSCGQQRNSFESVTKSLKPEIDFSGSKIGGDLSLVTLHEGLQYGVSQGFFSGGPIHVLIVDLSVLRLIQLDPTMPFNKRPKMAGQVGYNFNALAVTNSDFYDHNFPDFRAVGLIKGQDKVQTNSSLWYEAPSFDASFGSDSRTGQMTPFESRTYVSRPNDPALAEYTDIFTGSLWVLRNGVNAENDPAISDGGASARHPRTVLGLSEDGKTAILMVTQGRNIPTGARGYSLVGSQGIGLIAKMFGAYNALNFDGGGSSAMWIKDRGGIVNRPTDGHERSVAYHLAVVPVRAK